MDTFSKWFVRFMYTTEIIFLAASMPHIAAWFSHFDAASDWASSVYSWVIGYALAFAIDGVAFMLLLAIQRMLKEKKVNGWVLAGLLFFMAFIAALSWFINVQYDVEFASNSFAKADSMIIWGFKVGTINPIAGGGFQVLILAYALISKAVNSEVRPEMTDAEFDAQKKRIEREKALKALRKSDSDEGFFNTGREKLLGKAKDAQEVRDARMNATADFLRDAQELLDVKEEKRALLALSSLLKMHKKDVLPFLLAARSTIAREQEAVRKLDEFQSQNETESGQETDTPEEQNTNEFETECGLENDQKTDRDTDKLRTPDGQSDDQETDEFQTPDRPENGHETDEETENNSFSQLATDQPRGPIYTTLEEAILSTGYTREYLKKLVRLGTISTHKTDKNRLRTSSLNAYTSTHKQGVSSPSQQSETRTESRPISGLYSVPGTGEDKWKLTLDILQEQPEITDEELMKVLNLKRSASARFWRLKAGEYNRMVAERGKTATV